VYCVDSDDDTILGYSDEPVDMHNSLTPRLARSQFNLKLCVNEKKCLFFLLPNKLQKTKLKKYRKFKAFI